MSVQEGRRLTRFGARNLDSDSLRELIPLLQQQFAEIQAVLDALIDGYNEIRYTPPENPEEGMIVIADGTSWNPGGGGGGYIYENGSWRRLLSAVGSPNWDDL